MLLSQSVPVICQEENVIGHLCYLLYITMKYRSCQPWWSSLRGVLYFSLERLRSDANLTFDLAEMHIKYGKNMDVSNSGICLFEFCSLSLTIVFALRSMNNILVK